MATAPSIAATAVTRRWLLCLTPGVAVAAVVAAHAPATAGTVRPSTAAGAPECAADLVDR